MLRKIAVVAFVLTAAACSGCATFGSLTPGSNSDKGVWVAKTTSLFGMMLSDQQIIYCSNGPQGPQCTKAAGDVKAAKVSN